jgi:hypothetical protein
VRTRRPGHADSETKAEAIRKKYIREIARVCERLYKQYQSHDEGAGRLAAIIRSAPGRSARRRTSRPRVAARSAALRDAHGDMNTPATTLSGNARHAARPLLGRSRPSCRRSACARQSARGRTVIIGVRNLDTLEKEQIRDAKVHSSMKDIDQHGIAVVMKARCARRQGHAGHSVSFDMDVASGDCAWCRHAGQRRPRLP